MNTHVYLGADHAGFARKASVKERLKQLDYIVEDLGALAEDPADDYPEYAARVAQAVREHPGSLGVLSCGNAEGICIAANKFQGIRAGVGYSTASARTMRNDDDANIICVPGRLDIQDDPLEVVEAFLTTPFSGAERHKRRIAAIEKR
ncbi:MAG: RpiB/LacA/LacB family sugar-phosphate isomerase [Patescibacteria group bacterium]|jgi:ribose 5-phosphate isomerase B